MRRRPYSRSGLHTLKSLAVTHGLNALDHLSALYQIRCALADWQGGAGRQGVDKVVQPPASPWDLGRVQGTE